MKRKLLTAILPIFLLAYSSSLTAQVTISITSSANVSCNMGNDGSAAGSATGGTTPYTYSWNPAPGNGQNTANATQCTASMYTLFVHDALGLTANTTVTLTSPPALTGNITASSMLCFGANNGSATANVSGGVAPYIYSWLSGGQTTQTISSLTAGTYSCIVYDANGCTFVASKTISQGSQLVNNINSMPSSCGGATGYANCNASGGSSPYTYVWSPGGSTNSMYMSIGAGIYTCTVTDNLGCAQVNSVAVSNSGAPTPIIASVSNILCYGANNGSITASATGGAAPYIYSWTTGGSTIATENNLTAGTYTVAVTDASSCTAFISGTITQPATALAATSNINNVTCFGMSNGAATVVASGGTGSMAYSWSPVPGTAPGLSGLAPGTYSCSVRDQNNCLLVQTVTITQPLVISANPSQVNVSCFNGNNGSATVSPSGGTGGFNYSWFGGGSTTATFSGLMAGPDSCMIKDFNNCTVIQAFIITQPAQLSLSLSTTNVTCYGMSNGTGVATPSGGSGGNTYLWNPGSITTPTATGLAPGSYTCITTDSHGCTAMQPTFITQPSSALVSVPTQLNLTCNGNTSGSATVTSSGGTPAYQYSWTPTFGNTSTISGLSANNYTCVITDANNCTFTQAFSITEPAALIATLTPVNTSCAATCDGSVTASVSGGTMTYSYSWSPINGSLSTLPSLCPGTYTCLVKDANGCSTAPLVAVTSPLSLSVNTGTNNCSCYGMCDGLAQANPGGGTAPYTYSWNSGQTTPTISGVCSNTFTVTLTDSHGCTASNTAHVAQPTQVLANSLSWNNATCNGCDGNGNSVASGGTVPYTYLWTPGGQNTPSVTALCAGSYTCTVTDSKGCIKAANTTVTQSASPQITGSVIAPVSGTINSGKAFLVLYDSVLKRQQVVDSVAIISGRYKFINSTGKKFLVYAIPDHIAYPHTVKTYAGNADQWINATIVAAPCSTLDTANISVLESSPLNGAGTMAGYVVQASGYVPRLMPGADPIVFAPGEPIPGLDVNLEQHPGGLMYAQTTTDSAGKYHFGSVPAGVYQVSVDVPGLGMVSQYTRTITSNQMYTNLSYRLDSIHIYPDSAFVITGVPGAAPHFVNSFAVAPNPFRDQLNINYTLEESSDVVIEIHNILGETVSVISRPHQEAGQHTYRLGSVDQNLNQGVYLVRLTMGDRTFTQRIVKLH
jgi:hypothetical protein